MPERKVNGLSSWDIPLLPFSPLFFFFFFLTCKLQGGIKIAREAVQLTAFLRVYASDFRGCVGPRYTRNGYT